MAAFSRLNDVEIKSLFTAVILRGVFTRILSENPEFNGAKRCFLPFLCIAKRVIVHRTAFFSGAVNSNEIKEECI